MLRTVLEMTVREGCEEEFRAAWLETAEEAARLPGSVTQALLRDPRQPRTHLIMADWADRAALEAFQNSSERERLSARLEPFRENARKRVLEVVQHVPTNATTATTTTTAPPLKGDPS
ncbi:antibiotic biosynthesis monooxygenase [Streptomyces sp. ZAF1911]|uniref:antibiotic biosynthesis monooxygenase family protein n=1 Tax=Streptomyces sp. ZAF1911 TaxID=2944129 RepID=UPI00237AA232|nr:antibiotic biosynthesis monooxygenase family protein [Streptomyces sp. ZAF1911]MDD9376589.1 antibiotic biosynthesis monooxygenase [Streptomyces sp. ZAF1911]